MLKAAVIVFQVYARKGIDKIVAGGGLGEKGTKRKSPAIDTPGKKGKDNGACSWRGYSQGNLKRYSPAGRIEIRKSMTTKIIG